MDSAILIYFSMMPVISFLLLLAALIQADPTALGIDAFRQGKYSDARARLEKALAANPRDVTARAFLAMTNAANHECAPAIGEFVSNTDSALARMAGLAAVECDSATKHDEDALVLLGKLQARYPSDPDILYESAKLHRRGWDAAIAELYAKAPSSYRVNQLSGEIFETQGKYAEAAEQYSKAIVKAPDALNLHFRLGRCLLLDSPSPDALDRAGAQFELELKLNPSDAISEYQLGQIASARQKPDDASRHYERALQLRPEFAEALIAVGKIRAHDKQYGQAAQLFERAVAVQPESEAAHYNLMLAYRNSGHPAEALQQKKELDRLQKPPEGEFTEFLKKLQDKAPAQ